MDSLTTNPWAALCLHGCTHSLVPCAVYTLQTGEDQMDSGNPSQNHRSSLEHSHKHRSCSKPTPSHWTQKMRGWWRSPLTHNTKATDTSSCHRPTSQNLVGNGVQKGCQARNPMWHKPCHTEPHWAGKQIALAAAMDIVRWCHLVALDLGIGTDTRLTNYPHRRLPSTTKEYSNQTDTACHKGWCCNPALTNTCRSWGMPPPTLQTP